MRTNLPVTNVEYILNDSETVVSKTDLHGNITYVNQDFINISGFSEEELIGAPQNIVRHPDMPVEAFEDFWRTIRSGKAWTGLVKNRCKNGDHYWVEANAAPILENRQIVGFTSIEQVNQAIMQMDEVTQQNAGLVEQAAKLAQLVASFKLISGVQEAQFVQPQILSRRAKENVLSIRTERAPAALTLKMKKLASAGSSNAWKKS